MLRPTHGSRIQAETPSAALHEKFIFSFRNRIWRIMPDVSEGLLVLELREPETRTVSFVSLRPQTGETVCERFNMELGWWYGMEALASNVLLLHTYEDEQIPAHKSIFAFNALTGQKLWEHAALRFICAERSVVWAYDINGFSETPVLKIDLQNGHVLSEVPEYQMQAEMADIFAGRSGGLFKPNLGFPVLYNSGAIHFTTLSEFINIKTGSRPIKRIEYLEAEKHIIISWYCTEGQHLNNRLLVTDLSGNTLLSVTLGTMLNGISEYAFFTFGAQLIFPGPENTLNCYNLNFDLPPV